MAALFCGTAAYATQHFAYKAIQLVLLAIEVPFPAFSDNVNGMRGLYIAIFALAVAGSYYAFGRRIKSHDNLVFDNIIMIFISVVLITCTTTLNLVVESDEGSGFEVVFLIAGIYDMLCCLFALLMQFGMFREKKITNEYYSMKKIWAAERKRLEISKENLDYMRILAHDLKHEMVADGGTMSAVKLREFNRRLSSFGSTYKTGNDILDLVLAERKVRMDKAGIMMTCVANGEALSFMEPSDVFSLFMNLVDNAIEALTALPDRKLRTFTLAIREKMGMVFVHEENPVAGQVAFADGLPQTNKADSRSHGLGTRSMKLIAERYDGGMSARVINGVFVVDIILSVKHKV